MAEMVGLSLNIRLEWMELAANCRASGKSEEEAYPILNEKIGETIRSSTSLRRARAILFKMWYRPEDWFLDAGTRAAEGLTADERIGIHWALLLMRYPVFYDLCVVIGSLFDYRDEITLTQIRNRIFEKWGARNTLQNCLPKNIQTFKELKAITAAKSLGTYRKNTMVMNNADIMHLLCAAIIERSGKQYMTWEQLIQHPAIFPFKVENLTQADIAPSAQFRLAHMGDDVVISRCW